MDPKQLEKYSSAFTLSDMEIFIFPELLFSLVLANILSPVIWKWRDDPWFEKVDKMGPIKKIHRLKQYIMDHYDFNLDLETWGLTDKQTEINRFRDFVDIKTIEQSNALFGYEGDKYYFSIDIRKHFGLDKYERDIIPYWKTETAEAMDAFRFKPGHATGAGECVSLACLYAAALFIVTKIPLEKIFLMGTPLHSQDFILTDTGVISNNRRILTKTMWFNGTELSALARRALEHEQVTMVAHLTGFIHAVYPEATIAEPEYHLFRQKLQSFLETTVTYEIFINFLRSYSKYQHLFLLGFQCLSQAKYIRLEKAFAYEHDSKHKIGDKAPDKMLCEIDEEDFLYEIEKDRAVISSDNFIFLQKSNQEFFRILQQEYPILASNKDFISDLKKFVHTVPKLPSANKYFAESPHIRISIDQTREEITDSLKEIRKNSTTADLAFYAGRYMDSCDWRPFLKAAFERNPVSVSFFEEKDLATIYQELSGWPDESIYNENRLALPDEVVNYQRGDGIEKTITFVNVLKSKHLETILEQNNEVITIKSGKQKFTFKSNKNLQIPHQLF